MNILVVNGSPKGQNSITLQTTNYLKILHPEHEFSVLDAGQKIKASDLILFTRSRTRVRRVAKFVRSIKT